jgi:hypothetical protein
MWTLRAKDAKYSFGRLIDLPLSESVAVTEHVQRVVVKAVEHERLKCVDSGNVRARLGTISNTKMDEVAYDNIDSLIHDIEADPGSYSHYRPGSRTPPTNARRSESRRWR